MLLGEHVFDARNAVRTQREPQRRAVVHLALPLTLLDKRSAPVLLRWGFGYRLVGSEELFRLHVGTARSLVQDCVAV